MHLVHHHQSLPFLVEPSAHEGVRRIAGKVAADVEKISGVRPAIITEIAGPCVLCATLGCSPLIDALTEAGKFPQAERIRGKWECWAIARIDDMLVICGSDKRGTIYGLFALSEYIGVSPLCYWGDAEPLRRDEIALGPDIETVTKEPSVRYRGFFINDEWPCFGSWCMSSFGGVNAEMYDHVFELLLRLKGNYFWPAMWASVFGEEGPGSANEELADLYGVVVGNSHHEPCLRAGEEFKHSIRDGAAYGVDWNFRRNREGITRFWADGLKRSGKYEHLITIGMRGEADSAMLGEDAGLRANIEYLKDVITVQEELIRTHCTEKSAGHPRVLALYKEVEPFFYGSSTVQGLKDWEGLRNTICMLCEDNHGFLRSLPTPELTQSLKARGCGWGMYYHVDYHGGPVSYEWMPSTPFPKLWEQMCLAYDYGVRDVWILNTGDLKGNEVSLKQFLDLAYDYDRWGSHIADNWRLWLEDFVSRTFPDANTEAHRAIVHALHETYRLNGMRRPEALHAGVYHPCHENETSNMLALADAVPLTDPDNVQDMLTRPELVNACLSMVTGPAMASMNLLKMQLYAGLNAHYAAQGRPAANHYADLVDACMQKDAALCAEYAAFRDGKWRGMEQEAHIGFTSWNEDGCKLPLRTHVYPWKAPRLSVSRADDDRVYGKVYGTPMTIRVDDFCDAGVTRVTLEIANAGTGELNWRMEGSADWLDISPREGRVRDIAHVSLDCRRDLLTTEVQRCTLSIIADDATVNVDVSARAHAPNELPAYMPVKKVVAIDAHHFCRRHDVDGAAFRVLPGYGRSGNAVKVYPNTAAFQPGEDAPSLTYRFFAENAGEHVCELWLTPTSPVQPGVPMRCTLTAGGETQTILCIPADYRPGENSDPRWCEAMVSHIRKVQTLIRCSPGVNEITLGAADPNLILERILIYPAAHQLPDSCLGPRESTLI
ncbi:MAG: glycosyl hydrolase 115 family protein [Clostridia bacterium]|nr:glycosyl hydrolase 115 family protein [Clostridia bacterium]